MSLDLSALTNEQRLLFEIPLKPVQGQRFQPTGFPGLGAATFQTAAGLCLLVESAQSTANRLELKCWDDAAQDLKPDLQGLSHVRVSRKGAFLTDTILEAHRINSPYLLKGTDKNFFGVLKNELGGLEEGPIDRRKLASTLFKFDIGALIHGVFLAQKELAGGRLPNRTSAVGLHRGGWCARRRFWRREERPCSSTQGGRGQRGTIRQHSLRAR